MEMHSLPQNEFFETCYKKILRENGIRFVGVLNQMGTLVVGGYKAGITPLVDDEEEHKMCLEYALELSLTKDLDNPLGPVEYNISKRKNVSMIAIPLNNHSVLISIEPETNPISIINKVKRFFNFQQV